MIEAVEGVVDSGGDVEPFDTWDMFGIGPPPGVSALEASVEDFFGDNADCLVDCFPVDPIDIDRSGRVLDDAL